MKINDKAPQFSLQSLSRHSATDPKTLHTHMHHLDLEPAIISPPKEIDWICHGLDDFRGLFGDTTQLRLVPGGHIIAIVVNRHTR